MSKIGRNQPCPCGSGKKYKHCCNKLNAHFGAAMAPSAESIARLKLFYRRQEAREHQRRLMQGLGRPIISFTSNGYRVVVVGNDIRWSLAWKTFPDFLNDYLKSLMTPEWGNAELAKPEAERHTLIRWFGKVGDQHRKYALRVKGELVSAPMTGAAKAYLGLAYDLYLCAHNAELPDLLLKRLRNSQTFEGAIYEAYVIGALAKAGFEIELEDEGDSTRSHCELTATHKETGRKFSVEAKAIASSSKRSGASAEPPKIRGKLYDALAKQADHERLIFIELNRVELGTPGNVPDWVEHIDAELAEAAKELTIDGQPAPPAYVFVTNRGFMHGLDSERWAEVGLSCGFKIDDFASRTGARTILDLVHSREKHKELHWLRKALERHNTIPSTFDDRLPEEQFDSETIPPLLIGNTYLVPGVAGGEVEGVLLDASVLEADKIALGTYRLKDGTQCIYTTPLTDKELAIYRLSPDTFFGIVKEVSKGITEPLDCYDFLWGAYSKTAREKLLEFVAGWPDYAILAKLDQKELAEIYCARMAENMWRMGNRPAVKTTVEPKEDAAALAK